MNPISLNFFNSFDTQTGFSPEPQTAAPPEDFSAILTNIAAALEPGEASVFAPEPEKPDYKVVLELPPCDQPPIEKRQSVGDNNLLEIPTGDLKSVDIESFDQIIDEEASKSSVVQIFPVPAPPAPLPPDEKTAAESPTLETLWAGTHLEIRQRINNYKFEISAKERLKAQINDLFQKDAAPVAQNNFKFKANEEIPASLFPELTEKTENKFPASFFAELKTAASRESRPLTAPSLFQAETSVPLKTRILKFEKPADVRIKSDLNPKDFLPTTIEIEPPRFQTADNFSTPPTNAAVSDQEMNIQAAVPVKNLPFISEIAPAGNAAAPQEIAAENILPRPESAARAENFAVKGVEITRGEVNSILKTFDRFFKKAESSAVTADNVYLNGEISQPETFEQIAQSIKDSFAAVMKPVNKTAVSPETPAESSDNLWFDPKNSEIESPKTAGERIQTAQVKGAQPPVDRLTEVKSQPVIRAAEGNTLENASPEKAFNFQIGFEPTGENTLLGKNRTENFTARTSALEFGATEFPVKAEQTDGEVNAGSGGFVFDRFLENVAKESGIAAEPRPTGGENSKVLEQINPQMLELAMKTGKTGEKQSLKMRLHPAELGAVEILIERTDSGALNAYFHTETDGAQQALSQNLEQLRETLQQAGWQVGQMEISYGGGSSNADSRREQNERQSLPFENYDFNRTAGTPDASEPKNHNRLLSLLA